jgi:hypothetical protein
MTYGTVRIFADERVLERGVWEKVRRRGPHGIVGRIKRYLRVRGFVSHQNRPSCPRECIPRWTNPRFRAPERCPRRKRSVAAQKPVSDQGPNTGEEAPTSPKVVVASTLNNTGTNSTVFGSLVPSPNAPLCIAIAWCAPMVTARLPSEPIVKLRQN